MNFPKCKIYLSRRNLLTLLSKLDRDAVGEETACAIIKNRNKDDPAYQQTMDSIMVIAVQDEDMYRDRPAGAMLEVDTPPERHTTGTVYAGPIL